MRTPTSQRVPGAGSEPSAKSARNPEPRQGSSPTAPGESAPAPVGGARPHVAPGAAHPPAHQPLPARPGEARALGPRQGAGGSSAAGCGPRLGARKPKGGGGEAVAFAAGRDAARPPCPPRPAPRGCAACAAPRVGRRCLPPRRLTYLRRPGGPAEAEGRLRRAAAVGALRGRERPTCATRGTAHGPARARPPLRTARRRRGQSARPETGSAAQSRAPGEGAGQSERCGGGTRRLRSAHA